MKRHELRCGLNVFVEKLPSRSVTVEVSVNVGSVDESKNQSGISHFIEHMLFNGTKKRPSSRQISNEIEKLGGDFNAATSHERTIYYAKVPGKYVDRALDVLSDMIQNPLFDEKILEKEKKIIIDEINMINDQPRYYQWVFFQQNLFQKHPVRNAIYGSVDVVKRLGRKHLLDFYGTYYVPSNMSLFIVGDVKPDIMKKVESYFGGMRPAKKKSKEKYHEPIQLAPKTRRMKKKTLQSYMILGYKTPPRFHKDSYALDIVRAILGKGQSGRIFDRIRTDLGLAYDLGVMHNPSYDFGFFAVYVSTARKNQEKVRKEILEQLKFRDPTDKEISEAKRYIEGEFVLMCEDTQKRAELLAYWDSNAKVNDASEYLKKIRAVTRKDVVDAAAKWLNRNYTLTIIE